MAISHEHSPLDEIDRAILQMLQRDARHTTAVEIGEAIGVSDGTVRNRIEQLEKNGIITGFIPTIDYEQAGYQLQICIECTARIVDREDLAHQAREVEGVIEVREKMTGKRNVEVQAVAPEHDDVTTIARELDELGLEIENEDLLRDHYHRPFNHFGTADITTDREMPD